MRLRTSLSRVLGWAAVSAALLLQPAVAFAEAIYADFDRDGQRDVVSVAPGSRSTIQVWLSATQTLRHLQLTRPILRIVAFDLDGDGRPEIVASDTDAGLHIWRRTKSGHLKRVRPRPTLPVAFSAHRPGVLKPITEAADDPAPTSQWAPTANTAGGAAVRPPNVLGRYGDRFVVTVLDRGLPSSGSRAPPPRS
jgi:hypothetical protein